MVSMHPQMFGLKNQKRSEYELSSAAARVLWGFLIWESE